MTALTTTVNGKANSSHTHNYAGSSSAGGAATSATKLSTARTLTIGSKGKTFDGTGNVSWSLSEIGAASSSHNHTGIYLPIGGGKLTGSLYTVSVRPSSSNIHSLGYDNEYYAGVFANNLVVGNSSSRIGQFSFSNNTVILYSASDITARKMNNINTFIPMSASAFNVSSSRRYKTNICDISEERSKKLLDINIVTFDYNTDVVENGRNKSGVIAEDVALIIPEVA